MFFRKKSRQKAVQDLPPFPIEDYCQTVEGFQRADWVAIEKGLAESGQNDKDGWRPAINAWLNRIGSMAKGDHEVVRSDHFMMMAPADDRQSRLTLNFLESTRRRILRALPGIATDEPYEDHPVLVFSDLDDYYGYIGYHYPPEGEFAMSSGCFLPSGIGHFAFPWVEMGHNEPVISHELTHALLAHLHELPLWLNEGIAVNVEHDLCASVPLDPHDPRLRQWPNYWNSDNIQSFWSGESFKQPGAASDLSYHLARVLVSSLAQEYEAFQAFVCAAEAADGGQQACVEVYGVGLGELVGELVGS